VKKQLESKYQVSFKLEEQDPALKFGLAPRKEYESLFLFEYREQTIWSEWRNSFLAIDKVLKAFLAIESSPGTGQNTLP